MTPRRDTTIQLKDGRRLAYAEWGDPDGRPVLFFHGTPHSRLWCPDVEKTAASGVRLITVDRPGIGRSDPLKARTFGDWPKDVIELTEALAIDRFSVVGWSSGGPYAAACAALIPTRLTGAGIVSSRDLSYYNFEDRPAAYAELNDQERAEYDAAQHDALAAADLVASRWNSWVTRLYEQPENLIDVAQLPAGDRWLFEDAHRAQDLVAAVRESLRQGINGYRWEETAVLLPWGFRLNTIPMRVYVWHGEQDPWTAGVHVDFTAARLADCVLVKWPDSGHFGIAKHWDEILDALT